MVVVGDRDEQPNRSAPAPAAPQESQVQSSASPERPRNQGFFLRLRPDDDNEAVAEAGNRQESDEDDEEEDGDAGTSTSGSKLVQEKEFLAEDDPAAGNFDCNICLDLAQDPVVTLCGHLFCWPCLYKWLQLRPIQKECPVCKAPVHEEKVIPLYGRGSVDSADPRSSDMSEMAIPSRPQGHRADPQTALAWHARRFYDPYGFSFVAGTAGPAASARFGNVTFSAGFGLFPSLFRLHFHGFPDSAGVAGSMMPYGSFPAATSHHHHLGPLPPMRPDQQERILSRLLLFVGGVMILCFLYF